MAIDFYYFMMFIMCNRYLFVCFYMVNIQREKGDRMRKKESFIYGVAGFRIIDICLVS